MSGTDFVTSESFPGKDALIAASVADPPRDLSAKGFVSQWVAGGFLLPLPRAWEVAGRAQERACYVALVPLELGSEGGSRRLQVGDLLSAAEAAHSAIALQALVDRGMVAELRADRGLPAVVAALWARVRELDGLPNAARDEVGVA